MEPKIITLESKDGGRAIVEEGDANDVLFRSKGWTVAKETKPKAAPAPKTEAPKPAPPAPKPDPDAPPPE